MRGGLLREEGTLVRGIGFVRTESTLMAGSSGGFADSMDLIEARIDDRLLFQPRLPALELGLEKSKVNVSGREATNCAVPCYFVACGLAGADPPDTYKSCLQARMERSPLPRPRRFPWS